MSIPAINNMLVVAEMLLLAVLARVLYRRPHVFTKHHHHHQEKGAANGGLDNGGMGGNGGIGVKGGKPLEVTGREGPYLILPPNGATLPRRDLSVRL